MSKKKGKEIRRYGQWAGNPNGDAERLHDCVRQVRNRFAVYGYQCTRKRGHGPSGLYCKQHAAKFNRKSK